MPEPQPIKMSILVSLKQAKQVQQLTCFTTNI